MAVALARAAGRAGEGRAAGPGRAGRGHTPAFRAPTRRPLRRCGGGAGAAVAAGLRSGGRRLSPPDRGRSLRPGDPALGQDPQPLHGALRRVGECRAGPAAAELGCAAVGAAADGRDRGKAEGM